MSAVSSIYFPLYLVSLIVYSCDETCLFTDLFLFLCLSTALCYGARLDH